MNHFTSSPSGEWTAPSYWENGSIKRAKHTTILVTFTNAYTVVSPAVTGGGSGQGLTTELATTQLGPGDFFETRERTTSTTYRSELDGSEIDASGDSGSAKTISQLRSRDTSHATDGTVIYKTVIPTATPSVQYGTLIVSETETRTYNGADTFTATESAGGPFQQVTTADTQDYTKNFLTTVSTTIPSGPFGTTSWTVEGTTSEVGSSQVISVNTDSAHNYVNDTISYATMEVVIGTSTFTSPGTADELTLHAFDLEDTVILAKAARGYEDHNLGDEVWVFSVAPGMPANASTEGLLTELYSAETDRSFVISDYSKYSSTGIAGTAITVSSETTATTKSVQTGSHPSQTTTTNTTLFTTYKNGDTWHPTNTANKGTTTHIFDHGAVGTLLTTYEAGEGEPAVSETLFTHTIQISGYDTNGNWTAGTETAIFGAATSLTETYLTLHSPVSVKFDAGTRATFSETILVSSQQSVLSGTDTVWRFVGLVDHVTTAVFNEQTFLTSNVFESKYNPEIDRFTWTRSSDDGNDSYYTTDAIGETDSRTFITQDKLWLHTWTNPHDHAWPLFTNHNNVWFKGPAAGFAGPGGNFEASSLPVYLTVGIAAISGGGFFDSDLSETQSLRTDDLPTALAYEWVTFFPARTDYTAPEPLRYGMVSSRYLSRTDSIGADASVAVTWSSTTETLLTAGTEVYETTVPTSTYATYLVAGISSITGTFYRSEEISMNTGNVRGAGFASVGGYACGNHALGATDAYTVRIGAGHAKWTEYGSASTVSVSRSSSQSGGSLTFSVAGDQAIVIEVQPIFSANWKPGAGVAHFFSSVPHFFP